MNRFFFGSQRQTLLVFNKMKKYLPQTIFSIFVFLSVVFLFWQTPVEYLKLFVSDNSIWSVLIFVFLMIISTVFAPLTILPMVPFVGVLLGSFNTAIYSVLGWVVGSMIAFWIARYAGRPVLKKFVPEKDIEKYQKYVPKNIGFWWVVLLRMTIPVDVLSYLIGFLTEMGAKKYFLATLIGIIPFSFIFAYGYNIALFEDKIISFSVVGFIVLILSFSFYLRKRNIV